MGGSFGVLSFKIVSQFPPGLHNPVSLLAGWGWVESLPRNPLQALKRLVTPFF